LCLQFIFAKKINQDGFAFGWLFFSLQ
jgi:hypothetical protein